MTTPDHGATTTVRWTSAALAGVAAVIVATCGYSAFARIGAPFPGFFVWQNGFVPAVGTPAWSGAASGLPYYSWIEGVEGAPLTSVGQIDDAAGSQPLGRPVRYSIRHEGTLRDIEVPSERFSTRHFAVSTGIYLFDAVVLLLLAIVMFYVGSGDPGARAVGLFALVQSLFLATSIDLFGPYRFRELYFFFAGLTPTATMFMVSRFPVERRIGRLENALLGAALAASLSFGLLSNAFFYTNRDALLALDRALHLAMAAGALAAFAFFARHYVRGRSEAVRRRCQVVLLASIGGFLPTMVFLFAAYAGGFSVPLNFLALPFVLFPIGIGYAVARYDLFDIDTVVKRTIVYATLSTAVFGVYSIAINLFDAMFENASPVASRLAEGTVIVTLLVLFDPSRRRLQETVNRLYDRRRWVYRDVVRSAVRAFSTILDLDQLVTSVLGLVDDSVQPTFACIYTIAGSDAPRLRGGLLHAPGANATIDVHRDGPEAPELAALARVAAAREAITDHDPDAAALDACGAAVAFGLALEGKATGLLAIGPRRSGAAYTREDIDLLRTIAGQLAVAMRNAESYQVIDTLNRDLEGKNVELGHALTELREAQDELIVKERLAAIGEIAGAVAHTIRNPLAGMRATAQQASIELADHPVTELVDAFVRETDRLSSRIDSLLDFARPFHVNPSVTALGEIARRAAEQVRGRAQQRRITIDDSRVSTDSRAFVDPELFEQLTVELIANAVDASPDGATVTVSASRNGHASYLEVRDQGPGIPPDRRERMFRMFFTTKAKGTGIGLATVKRIADAHHATIEVVDSDHPGACFRVTVPDRDQPSYLDRR
ncbi:MAG TPA: ATP-binding protein [Candidatus Limnocylindrales bacterium]|nr:ATP-binding protein [Candidatus Limnocylindrales bacterium]